jgi:hypothetical protein
MIQTIVLDTADTGEAQIVTRDVNVTNFCESDSTQNVSENIVIYFNRHYFSYTLRPPSPIADVGNRSNLAFPGKDCTKICSGENFSNDRATLID